MTITQTITSIAPAANPATMDRDTFSTTAAANVLAISNMTTELNTWTGQVNAIVSGAAGDIASGINGATAKTTPVNADLLTLTDSASSFTLKKFTWANLKATLKSYFDTLYPSGSGTSTGTNTGDQTATTIPATPSGNLAGTTVGAQLVELDTEKAALAGSSTQAFSVAAATAAAHAVRFDQLGSSLASGTFTITGTGFTATVTATATYKITNGVCHLSIPHGSIIGTSNATSFTLTGIPAACQPAAERSMPRFTVADNSGVSMLGGASITAGEITLTLSVNPTGWTASGSKALYNSEFNWVL
jgi:hypothetical protein